MSVPLFTLDNDIKSVSQDAFDTLILQLGKPCRLNYPPTQNYCPNCVFDTAAGKSSGSYLQGGPTPFPNGTICPACGGKGYLAVSQSGIITMLCNFKPSVWQLQAIFGPKTPVNLRVPNGLCLTKGFLTDVPKVVKCQDAVLATNVEPYLRYRFQLASEPVDNNSIVQARYFDCLWERKG